MILIYGRARGGKVSAPQNPQVPSQCHKMLGITARSGSCSGFVLHEVGRVRRELLGEKNEGFFGEKGAFWRKRSSKLFWGERSGCAAPGAPPCPGDTGGTRSGDIATSGPPGHAHAADFPAHVPAPKALTPPMSFTPPFVPGHAPIPAPLTPPI